jgi:hypothetical protein
MTCVIGTERWLCADRRITSSGGERCPNELKVWQGPHLIAAAAGSGRGIHKARRLVESGEAGTPEGLIDALADDAVYLRRGLWCIGSGGDLARGYLEGRALTVANARAAQRLAAQLRDDCGGGVNVKSWWARP